MDTIKLPITFDKGRMGVLADGSREYYSQIIAIACQIERGEMPLEVTYGITDPTFTTLRKSEIYQVLSVYWPEIKIREISISAPDRFGRKRLNVDFGE
jgi:hypothetical protein